jgi:hypothetical protein
MVSVVSVGGYARGDFFKARKGGARPGKRRVTPANLVLRQST